MGRWLALLTAAGVTGCLALEPPTEEGSSPIAAYCEAYISGAGRVDVERDYLPGVLQCENAGAPPDALRALAVAGRSYLYYQLANGIVPVNGPRDQDYRCGRPATEADRQAVRDTAGIVMRWQDEPVVGFYVAGAFQELPSCAGGTSGPFAWTEDAYVTINDGLEGDDVQQSELGWVADGNPHNRGCLSQNGSTCLARAGTPWQEILHYYYGEDVDLVQTAGPCTEPGYAAPAPAPVPVPPTPPTPPSPPPPPPEPGVCSSDRLEPNDRSRHASALAGALEGLSVCRGDTADWFRVTDADGQLRVDLEVAAGGADLDLELYDTRAPYAWRAGAYTRRSSTERLSLAVTPGGSYWVRVYVARGTEAPSYTIRAQ